MITRKQEGKNNAWPLRTSVVWTMEEKKSYSKEANTKNQCEEKNQACMMENLNECLLKATSNEHVHNYCEMPVSQ